MVAGPRGSEFRPDIEGLRGIAVVLVVLFHAGLVAIPGGFIGVDVFFVISGFLITGLLIREREQSGGIRLPAFYARRVRRLLPAGMLALAVTLVASFLVLSPLDVPEATADAAAAALSVGNIRFALEAGDYFAAVEAPSPFLHFWSLGVEEQFYLIWPALILVAARWSRPRLGAGSALAVVVAGSIALSVALTDLAVNWAYYSLPTRAWQLGVGGLLALAVDRAARVPRAARVAAGWAGLLAILASAALLNASVPYPGVAALGPTVGAAALILCGLTVGGPGALLALPPLRFTGRISYSLYLWHWPILVLPAVAADGALPAAGRAALIACSFVVAWLSWRFVEEPFRVGFPSLSRRPTRTILGGATAVAVVVALATGLGAAAPLAGSTGQVAVGEGELPVPLDEAGLPGSALATPEAGASTATSPSAASLAPTAAPGSTPTAAPTSKATGEPVVIALPADVRPPLAAARSDEERLRRDGCLAFERVSRPPDCRYGDPMGATTVALVGDSHAAQWFPALERIAASRHWRLVTFVKVSCPFLDMRVGNVALKREYRECADWNAAVIDRLGSLRPDLTLISMSRFAIHPILARDSTTAAQAAAMARFVDRLSGRIGLVVDTPDAGRDIPSCLARHRSDVRLCAIPRTVAVANGLGRLERAAASTTGAGLIDLTTAICRDDPCPVVVDGRIVFRDSRHLTATFARYLAGDLDRAVRSVLGDG